MPNITSYTSTQKQHKNNIQQHLIHLNYTGINILVIMMAATATAPTTKKLIKSALIGAGLQQIDRDVLTKCTYCVLCGKLYLVQYIY